MNELPPISLVVVAYNSAAQLPACLDALAATVGARSEIIVVDNASTDGTPELVAERYPHARLLANHENIGFGCACNQGAQAAAGELLVFMNPDVVVTPGWLDVLARHMREAPDAGIICPTTLDMPEAGDWRLEVGGREQTSSLPPPTSSVADTAAVPGCAMMVRRAAWRDLGGFDERYFLYWEDTDLCWRAWLLGWRVLEDFEACVYHERGGSAGSLHWDAELTKNSLRTYLKTMRWRRSVPFVAALAFKTMAKIALRRQRGLLSAWAWNWRHLGETLALRRELARARRGNLAELERMIGIHQRRGRNERRARRQRQAGGS